MPETRRGAAPSYTSGLPPVTLTARQAQVAELLAAGHTRQEVADALGCSFHTVRAHMKALAMKLPGDGNLRARIATYVATLHRQREAA